jgi:benzoate membrane transport protein
VTVRPRGRLIGAIPPPTAPRFDPATLVGVGLPLFLLTMASQNVPGTAVLAAHGYRPRPEPVADAR